MKIALKTNKAKFDIELNNTDTARAIHEKLPIKARAERWGEEIYFEIPVEHLLENGTTRVKVGDVGFWPEGNCFCVFFGRTPASKDNEPMPAGEVTIIGKTSADVNTLRLVAEGAEITLEKAD